MLTLGPVKTWTLLTVPPLCPSKVARHSSVNRTCWKLTVMCSCAQSMLFLWISFKGGRTSSFEHFQKLLKIRHRVNLGTPGTRALVNTLLLVSRGLRWTSLLIWLIARRGTGDSFRGFLYQNVPCNERGLMVNFFYDSAYLFRYFQVYKLLWRPWVILNFSLWLMTSLWPILHIKLTRWMRY